MARALWFFAKVAIAVGFAVWLAERPGVVTIDWQGWQIETSVGFLAATVFLAIVVAALSYSSWRYVRQVPRRVIEMRRAQRQAKGYRALTQGMVAVAAGEAEEARRQARRADSLLDDPPLTLLLTAQSAQLDGDEAAARRYFTAMLNRPETTFLGLRGLIMQALKAGNRADALALTERAHGLRPATPWVLEMLVDLRSRGGAWREAQLALEEGLRRKVVPRDRGERWLAALLMERARASDAHGEPEAALQQARRAHELDPGLAPAAAMLAKAMSKSGGLRRARRVLEEAWVAAPHPDLAASYLEISGETDSLKQLKVLERLATLNPKHFETRVALAEAMLDAALWGEARQRLMGLIADVPSARLYQLMARVEEGEGKVDAVRDWLDQAALAEPGAGWVCTQCGARAETWAAVCGHCDALGGISWQVPPQVRVPALSKAERETRLLATAEAAGG